MSRCRSCIAIRGVFRALRFAVLAALAHSAPGQVPVTDRPVNNAPGVFRFAIVADRAGGIRPGVFENAVAKLKLLQPEFVLSVGDLIDGYTTDPSVNLAQWQEFERIVQRLDMPFYFVPGNHDISNPGMLAAWKQRRGDPWFSFVHQDVLFICLHTEDRAGGGLGDEQIAWVRKTLAEHAASVMGNASIWAITARSMSFSSTAWGTIFPRYRPLMLVVRLRQLPSFLDKSS